MKTHTIPLSTFVEAYSSYFNSYVTLSDHPFTLKGYNLYSYKLKIDPRGGITLGWGNKKTKMNISQFEYANNISKRQFYTGVRTPEGVLTLIYKRSVSTILLSLLKDREEKLQTYKRYLKKLKKIKKL